MSDLLLGTLPDGQELRLPLRILTRHVVALGASGSGKTVLCKALVEECAMRGVPALILDPQGDLASLGLPAAEAELVDKGLPAGLSAEYAEKVEVVVWTPGSALGVPLSVNPLATLRGGGEELERDVAFAAESLADLLGFSPHLKDGRYIVSFLSLVIGHTLKNGQPLDGVPALLKLLAALPKELADRAASLLEDRLLEELIRRLRTLTLGSQGRLFGGGLPLDIDMLLGRGPGAASSGKTKTRVSVVYLNTLSTEQEKQFFVGQLAQALYRWMLEHPSEQPQALFYIDEIAPFLPPVREPVCKDALKMLFRQARKYGLCCVAATQNPGDLDYKALAQISTWALGRMMTRQDIKKVEGALGSLAPDAVAGICERLPSLEPGRFILLSPDAFDKPVNLRVRWLLTRHRTLNEQEIAAVTPQELRARLEAPLGLAEEAGPGGAAGAGQEAASGNVAVGRVEVRILGVDAEGEGSVNPCEIVLTRGTGRITALGGQSKVTKESIKVAWNAAAQLQSALDLPLNLARRYDVTVLDTRISVKKDGPSAGLAYLTGIVAAFLGKKPRPDVAMTGEITMLGNVLAVGGIEEKLRAAYGAGYSTVVIPAENARELEAKPLPPELRRELEIILVSTVQQALPVLFAEPRSASLLPREAIASAQSEPRRPEAAPEPAAPSRPRTTDERAAELLEREARAFDAAQVAEALELSESAARAALGRLASAETARKAKSGRRDVYFHARHQLAPEYGLLEPVDAVRLRVLEPQARKLVESTLASSFLVFAREQIRELRLAYLPLYRLRITAKQKEGWVFKREVERRDNLYFHALTAEPLSYGKGRGFQFSAELPDNPIDVVDLDDLGCLETQMPGALELDKAEMDAILGEKAIQSAAVRLFSLEILSADLVFLPVWRAIVKDTRNSSERDAFFDGYDGKPIAWSRPRK